MTHNESRVKIDDLFAGVGGVVCDAFDRLCDREQTKRVIDWECATRDLLLRGFHQFLLQHRDGVVEEQDLLREGSISVGECAV